MISSDIYTLCSTIIFFLCEYRDRQKKYEPSIWNFQVKEKSRRETDFNTQDFFFFALCVSHSGDDKKNYDWRKTHEEIG